MSLISLKCKHIQELKTYLKDTAPELLNSKIANAIIILKPGLEHHWGVDLGKTSIFTVNNCKLFKVCDSTVEEPTLLIIGGLNGWGSLTISLTPEIIEEVYTHIPNYLKGKLGGDKIDEVGLFIGLHPMIYRNYLEESINKNPIINFIKTVNTAEFKKAHGISDYILRYDERFKFLYLPEENSYVIIKKNNDIIVAETAPLLQYLNIALNKYDVLTMFLDGTFRVTTLHSVKNSIDAILKVLT